ncbi:hypothetical protein OROGR_028784 [Orobanche gracilis]
MSQTFIGICLYLHSTELTGIIYSRGLGNGIYTRLSAQDLIDNLRTMYRRAYIRREGDWAYMSHVAGYLRHVGICEEAVYSFERIRNLTPQIPPMALRYAVYRYFTFTRRAGHTEPDLLVTYRDIPSSVYFMFHPHLPISKQGNGFYSSIPNAHMEVSHALGLPPVESQQLGVCLYLHSTELIGIIYSRGRGNGVYIRLSAQDLIDNVRTMYPRAYIGRAGDWAYMSHVAGYLRHVGICEEVVYSFEGIRNLAPQIPPMICCLQIFHIHYEGWTTPSLICWVTYRDIPSSVYFMFHPHLPISKQG